MYVDSYLGHFDTSNVIAETHGGDHNNVVSLGAHSDSVIKGPVINDDGSGAISLLEVAKQLKNHAVKNVVHFIWFTSEELNLESSFAHTTSFPRGETKGASLYELRYDGISKLCISDL